MSRIRGIEVKVQKEVLQTRKYGLNQILKSKNEEQINAKEDIEKQQISELLHKLPPLDNIFEVHRKIGEGTFSSVYLGSLKQHSSLPVSERRWFAIKHLVPTAHPARIEHELRCLQDMGGKNNVIGVDLCLRRMDTIVFIMPYIPHKKFSEYVGDMDASEVRRYMRALLVALRHVHSFGVIHRDVKPSNFLYDRDNKRYLLVDFGLAQRICPAEEGCDVAPLPAHSNTTRKRLRDEQDESTQAAKRMALDLSVGTKKINNNNISDTVKPVGQSPKAIVPKINIPKENGSVRCACAAGCARCRCACMGVGGVCGWCAGRSAARAARAGTQGFRPPEVLLKVPHQTTAVDMWACGVVLASTLSARYPFFRAADDVTALAELADLIGTEPLQMAAESLGRRIVTSSTRRGVCLRRLCARLRRATQREPAPAQQSHDGSACAQCKLPTSQCLCRDETKKPEEFDASLTVAGFPDSAFGLAARLLDPNPRTRISAAEALQHPFLAGDD